MGRFRSSDTTLSSVTMAKAMKATKAMKAMAAMKAMRAMKKKAVSKIAKGKLAKLVVFRGTKAKTSSGLSKTDLTKNKNGKIVSKKQSAQGKKAYANKGLDCRCPEGKEGFGREGLRRSEEGNSSLQESQGALPVSSTHEHTEASAQGVGMSTPLERSCFGGRDVW